MLTSRSAIAPNQPAEQYRRVIISHRHKFIFFAIPKTGTQSVRAGLRPLLGDDDWEQADWGVDKRLPIPEIADIGHGHITAAEVRPWLEDSIWRDYFKFAFVRNPWDRFISCAFFKNAKRPLFHANPRGYLKLLLRSPRNRDSVFFRPQYEFLHTDGDLAMNYIGRFETLDADFAHVCRHIGVRAPLLPHFNASQHDAYAGYYDEELTQETARYYERDIECFDYAGARPAHDCVSR